MKFSKKIVSLVIIMIVLFTIGVLYAFLKVGSEPAVLIGAFFGFATGELWMLAGIKKNKIKSDDKKEKEGE